MLQVGFCAQALEHSIANYETTFAKRVACIKKARESVEECRTLAEHKRSAAEACQTLGQELNSLSTRNNELQRELDATYQEVAGQGEATLEYRKRLRESSSAMESK